MTVGKDNIISLTALIIYRMKDPMSENETVSLATGGLLHIPIAVQHLHLNGTGMTVNLD